MTENDIIQHRLGNPKTTYHLSVNFCTLRAETDLFAMPTENENQEFM